jgi:hypothetical protein
MVSFMIRHFKLSNLHTHALLPRHIAWLYCSNDNTDQWRSIQTNDLRLREQTESVAEGRAAQRVEYSVAQQAQQAQQAQRARL